MRSSTSPTQIKSDRIRDEGKPQRAEPAQLKQRHRSIQPVPKGADQQHQPRQQNRLQPQEKRKARPNQQHTPSNPAPRAAEVSRFPTPLACCRADAMPLGKRDNLLRRRKRTRKTRRKTVRQSAECHPAVSTVPARNPGPNWRLASVGPVPPQPATSIASPTAPRGTCIPPRLPATVLSGGQTGLETELQWPSTARRLMVARADPLLETRTPDAATPCPETRRPLPDYNEPASQKAASSESASSESASSETACLEKKPTEPYRINPRPLKSVTGIARYKRAYFGRDIQGNNVGRGKALSSGGCEPRPIAVDMPTTGLCRVCSPRL